MRTRNRGQRTSIVSTLGLCPKNRKSRYLRKIKQKTHSAVRGKRKVLGSKVERLTTALSQQTNRKKLRKNNEVQEQKQMTEQLRQKSQKVRSSSRWRLSSEVASQLSRVSLFKKDSFGVSHNSVENTGSSRSEAATAFRGRKRQYSKVGRPRLVKPSETNQRKTVKKPPCRSSRFRNSQSTINQDSSTATEKRIEINKASFDGQNSPDTATISTLRVPQNVQKTETAPVVKRPRGRPRSNMVSKRKDIERSEHCTKQEPQSPSTDRYENEQKGTANARTFNPQVICSSSIYFPKLIKKDDLYCATDLRFGATDSILQQLLQEVSAHGVVPKHYDHMDYSGCKNAEENASSNAVFMFDAPIVKDVFENIWNKSDTVLDLDTKDLFLALNGLLRPGVCEIWRRRLEDQSKKLSRSHMGRLRPNPRPRRYSDMFVSSGGQPSGSRYPVPDIPLCTDKARLGSRCVAIAAARLTAAKKLIRARSHHNKGSRVVASETYGLLNNSYQSNIDDPNVNSRSRRKAQKASAGIEISSPRTRRRPDVSHHIDWKFCYAQSDKPSSTVNTNPPKRRRRLESSPDKPHASMAFITPESEEVCSTEDSTAASYDIDTASVDNHRDGSSLPGVLDTNLDPVKSDPALGEPNTYSFELKKSLSCRLDIERPIDGRRKRRHALTVQRKRPVERPISSFMESEHLLWRGEVPEKHDALSDSSDNSAPVSNYDRPFGAAKWIRPPAPKPKGNLDSISDSRYKSTNHSADLMRPRNIVGGSHTKRSMKNSQLQSYIAHRGRTSRRPDRMCRLTLLDRLVLGLNCSVAQNDDEIHVKRLHEDELSILTQRINRTGFSVHSVSVRKSANNDAEYNIVLTFSPNADASMRRVRCSPLGTRTRMPSSMRSLERGSRGSSTLWSGNSKLKDRQFPMHPLELRSSSRKSLVHSNDEHSHRRLDLTYSVSSGYHSDTDVLCKKVQLHKLRRAHSDTDLIELQQSEHEPISAQRNLESLPIQATNVPFPSLSLEVNGERQPSVSSGTFQTSKEWSRCSTFDRVSSPLTDRHYFADGTQKRGVALSRTGTERQSYENEGHSMTAATTHGITKRPLALDSQVSNHITPFRRHSPRKVIRKVYTGSSTIPKILNRKRPTGSPSVHLSAPTCSVPSTSSLLTSLSHATSTNAGTSSAVNSLATSSCTPNVSSASTPTIIFDAPTPSLPICPPTSVAGFSFQYRRFPAPVMPVTVVPTSTKLVDHSINVAVTTATSASVYNDGRLPGVVRFRPVSSITMGSTVAPAPIKTPERTHLTDVSISSSIGTRRLSTGPQSTATEDPESHVSMTDGKTGIPNLNTDVPKPSTNTISSSDATTDVPRLSKTTELRSSASVVAAPSSHLTSSVAPPDGNAELTNCENELPSDWDGSNTPATSMSASQLLKLKRLHDEAGRAVSAPSGMSESRTTQSALYSSFPGRVQSPQTLPLQGKQAQSIHTETVGVAQLGQPSQPEYSNQELPQQQHPQQQQQQKQPLSNSQQPQQQPQRASLSIHQGDPSFCAVPSVTVGSDVVSMDVTEDSDEFELKSIDQSAGVICPDPTHTDPATLVTADTVPPSSTVVSSASSDSILQPSLAYTTPRLQRLPWPVVRPPNSSGSVTRPSVLASATGSTTGQLTTRVVMQTPSSLGVPVIPSNTPSSTDSSTTDHSHHRLHHAQHQEVTLSCSPLMLPPSMSVGTASTFDPSSQPLSVTNYSQPNAGSLKRTIVHKYHSFRKILPKSPEHLGNFVSTATLHTIPTLGTSSPGLTQLPMIGTAGGGPSAAGSGIRMYRNVSLSQPNLLSCDSPAETAYFVDIPANLTDVTCDASRTVGHSTSFGLQAYANVTTMTNTTTSTAAASSMIINPASQLLKSLLESSDAKETTNAVLPIPVQQPAPLPGPKKTLPNVTSSTGVVTWNQPAHQSRGTWQLGKRVHSTSASSRSVTDNTSSVHSRHSANSELCGASDTGEQHSHSTTELASSVKLFPGPKSRLQQLQQHYQRRSQLQQVQPKSQSSQPPTAAPSQQPQALDQIVHEQPT